MAITGYCIVLHKVYMYPTRSRAARPTAQPTHRNIGTNA